MTASINQVAYYCGCLGQAITGEEKLPTHCIEHGDPIMPGTWERIEKSDASANSKASNAKFGGTRWAEAFYDHQRPQKDAQQHPKN